MKKILLYCLLLPVSVIGQEKRTRDPESGKLELGLRTTFSAFSDAGVISTGAGGQFRLRMGSRLNTEWFADYIKADLKGLGRRTDAHIGWSVMAYPLAYQVKNGAILPYILGGHCFDYTRVSRVVTGTIIETYPPAERWSSAVHLGLGSHYYLTHNFNLSLAAQYMIHLGQGLDASIVDDPVNPGRDYLYIEEGDLGLEGHLFISLSANIYMGDLWGREKK